MAPLGMNTDGEVIGCPSAGISPEDLPRATTGDIKAEEIPRLASAVFDLLAKGRDVIELADFRSCSKCLAKLSEDFVAEPDAGFARIDLNCDGLIQRDEFLGEIQGLAELVSVRKAAAELQRVRLELEGAGGPDDSVPAAAIVDDDGGHAGGQENRDPIEALVVKGRVLQKMLEVFASLQAGYSEELERVKSAREKRITDETAVAKMQQPPRIFATAPNLSDEETQQEGEQDSSDEGEMDSRPGDEEEDQEEADREVGPDDEDEDQEEVERDTGPGDEEDHEEDQEEEEEEDGGDGEEEVVPPAVECGNLEMKGKNDEDEVLDEDDEEDEDETDEEDADEEDEELDGADEGSDAELQQEASKKANNGRKAKQACTDRIKAAPKANAATEEQAPQPAPKAAARKRKRSKGRKPKARAKAIAPRPRPSTAPSPDPEGVLDDNVRSAISPVPPSGLKPPPRPGKPDAEGVRCMQTLEMGVAVRNAICIGKEVWTVDWKGAVSIREREDASKVKAEVATNRFVWAMGHMDPGLMWMGQEAQGISVFDSKKKEPKGILVGGHSGGVSCLALDEALGDEEDGRFPRRRAWSGSNDFTIRQWWIDTWRCKSATPEVVSRDPGAFTTTIGAYKVGITRGHAMHGHKNGVRTLLRIGPTLWSGSDDGSIRLWSTSDGECIETVGDAHRGSVLRLAIVRSFVWSAGGDGLVKEWTMVGGKRTCIRQVAPPGSEKGIYAVVPLGHDVWVAGHNPAIQVLSQQEMVQTSEHHAHEPYISNLLTVDTIFTRVVWSTSLGDRKLKVWKHTLRGSMPSLEELKAANRLYEEGEQERALRMDELLKKSAGLEDELAVSAQEYRRQLNDLSRELAQERARVDELEAARNHLEAEMEGLRKIFEDAGLGHLLQEPAALRRFLRLKKLFEEAGLGHLLEDHAALKAFLSMQRTFQDAGLGQLPGDPPALKAFLARATQLQNTLRSLGLDHLLDNPEELRRMLQTLQQLAQTFESYGLGNVLNDPSKLAEILSRYVGLQQAFEEHGYPELFDDPYNLKGFLMNYSNVREAFQEHGLEHLLYGGGALREFLAKHARDAAELADARLRDARLKAVERELAERDAALESALADLAALRKQLGEFTALGDLEAFRRALDDASSFRTMQGLKNDLEEELANLKAMLEQKERERLEALERERQMALQYKELDIFKLDIIARELKALDQELGLVGKQVRCAEQDVNRLKNYEERQQLTLSIEKPLDGLHGLRAHIRDVISKCLSETQKMHIGIAIEDHLAAGKLQDGGAMAAYVLEEVDVPDHGRSKAAKLRQRDEMARESGREHVSLPSLTSRPRPPSSGQR